MSYVLEIPAFEDTPPFPPSVGLDGLVGGMVEVTVCGLFTLGEPASDVGFPKQIY